MGYILGGVCVSVSHHRPLEASACVSLAAGGLLFSSLFLWGSKIDSEQRDLISPESVFKETDSQDSVKLLREKKNERIAKQSAETSSLHSCVHAGCVARVFLWCGMCVVCILWYSVRMVMLHVWSTCASVASCMYLHSP